MTNSSTIEPGERAEPRPDDDPIARAWEEVDRDWDDVRTHARLIELGIALDRLADVATRYRDAESTPERTEMANRQRDRIVAIALGRLVPTPPSAHAAPRRVVVAVGYLIALTLTAIAAYLLLMER